MATKWIAGGLAAFALIVLHACAGSGGSGGSGASTPTNASPGGIWSGTDPYDAADTLIGIITEDGEFTFLRSDGTQYYGTVTTAGNDIAGTYTGVAPIGFTFNDGSTYGTGTVSGTIEARSMISATATFTTHKGTNLGSESLSLTYDSLYESGSSLAAIAGNYTDEIDNSIISISATGIIFSEDIAGCVVNGQVSLIDTRYDAYRISYSFSACAGSSAFLSGTTATGLGVLDTTVSPNVLDVGVQIPVSYDVLNGSYQMQ